MREITGDLWDFVRLRRTAVVIPTNGSVRKDGRAVMGRGVALQAKERYPLLAVILGGLITRGEHTLHILSVPLQGHPDSPGHRLIIFPVKHDWRQKADFVLINRSARQLGVLGEGSDFTHIYLPRVGCGNGGRDWETEVKPILMRYLDDDKFVVVRP